MKRMFRGIVLSVAVMALALGGTAHATVTVGIDLADGDVLFSLPGLPDPACIGDPAPPTCSPELDYPAELQTVVTGTASFDVTEGIAVVYRFIAFGPNNEEIQAYTGQATLAEDCSSACTWSFRVPFVLPPSEYELRVIASQPNPENPEEPGESAAADVTVLVL